MATCVQNLVDDKSKKLNELEDVMVNLDLGSTKEPANCKNFDKKLENNFFIETLPKCSLPLNSRNVVTEDEIEKLQHNVVSKMTSPSIYAEANSSECSKNKPVSSTAVMLKKKVLKKNAVITEICLSKDDTDLIQSFSLLSVKKTRKESLSVKKIEKESLSVKKIEKESLSGKKTEKDECKNGCSLGTQQPDCSRESCLPVMQERGPENSSRSIIGANRFSPVFTGPTSTQRQLHLSGGSTQFIVDERRLSRPEELTDLPHVTNKANINNSELARPCIGSPESGYGSPSSDSCFSPLPGTKEVIGVCGNAYTSLTNISETAGISDLSNASANDCINGVPVFTAGPDNSSAGVAALNLEHALTNACKQNGEQTLNPKEQEEFLRDLYEIISDEMGTEEGSEFLDGNVNDTATITESHILLDDDNANCTTHSVDQHTKALVNTQQSNVYSRSTDNSSFGNVTSGFVSPPTVPIVLVPQETFVIINNITIPKEVVIRALKSRNVVNQRPVRPIRPKESSHRKSEPSWIALKKSLDSATKLQYQCEIYNNSRDKRRAIYVVQKATNRTNLHVAVINQNKELVFSLVEIHCQYKNQDASVAINAEDKYQKTARHYAITQGNTLISDYLGLFSKTDKN